VLGRRTLEALLLALALCAIVDVGCRLVFPRSGAMTRFDSARAFLAHADVPDVQIVGDSVSYWGIMASALAADESIYVRNDSLSGSLLPHSYYLLRREIEAHRAPRALVIAHTPFGLNETGAKDLAASFLDWGELLEMSATEEWPTALFGILSRSSYVLMNRSSFRRLFIDGDPSFFLSQPEKHLYRPTSDVRTLELYRGEFFDSRAPDGFVMSDISAYHHLAKFHVSRETHTYLRKLLALAKQNGVQVFWITTPVPRAAIEPLRGSRYEDDLADYLAQFERSGELTVIQGRFFGYDDNLFRDFIHPGPAVAVQFSCELLKLARGLQARVADKPRLQLIAESGFRTAALAAQHDAREELAGICAPAPLSAASVD
jgi:hypothetical protein